MAECAPYLQDLLPLFRLKRNARKAVAAVRASSGYRTGKLKVIVCSGVSGLLVAPTIAMRLGLHLVVVRKPEESRHSPHEVEYGCVRLPDGRGYLLVDDFVDSGDTLRRMAAHIDKGNPSWRCLGGLLVVQDRGSALWVTAPFK